MSLTPSPEGSPSLAFDTEERERQAREEFLRATDEEWACLEGHAIGRVIDEGPPTEPLGFPNDEPLTDPLLSLEVPDGAVDALRRAGLVLGPHEGPDASADVFDPHETLTLSSEMLATLRRRSSMR